MMRGPGQVFIGREAELQALNAALARAEAGQSQVVLIQGEAGIGKSSLVARFLGDVESVPVISASGEPAEEVLAYGLVQQLVASSAGVHGTIAGLKLLAAGPPPDGDPLAVGAELLALISSLPGDGAMALVVEDLQWADALSVRALLFACRRLSGDRVLVLITCRADGWERVGEGWTRFLSGDRRVSSIVLGGFNVAELEALCRKLRREGVTRRALQRVADFTGGNPLFAREVLADLSDEALAASDEVFRAPRSLAGLFLPRLAALPAQAASLLAAASVLGERSALIDVAAVAGVEDSLAALEHAEGTGILTGQATETGWLVSFTHPLVRQLVYDDLTPERRRQLHLRAAEVTAGQEALSHRVAAAVGPDRGLAADLAAAARSAAGAGQFLLAARFLRQAAAVTVPGAARDEYTLAALELLVRAGDISGTNAVRPAVERLAPSVRRETALGRLALMSARPWEADALLRAAWDLAERMGEQGSAGEAALWLGQLLATVGSFAEAGKWLDRALENRTGHEEWFDAARFMRCGVHVFMGDIDQAMALLTDLPDPAALVPAARTDALIARGGARLAAGELRSATDDLGVAAHRISGGAPTSFPGQSLVFLAQAEFRLGRWDSARGHAELAVSLARDTDRDHDLAFVHSAVVEVAACRGDWAAALEHAESADRAARVFGGLASICAASASGILGFARNDPQQALDGTALALTVPQADQVGCFFASWWMPSRVWALIRTGKAAEGGEVLGRYELHAARSQESAELILAAWLRGLLACIQEDFDYAGRVLEEGRHAARSVVLPFHRALLDLQHGQCLALLRRRRDAIETIRAARDAFAGLGAAPFIDAANSELAALGLRPPQSDERPGSARLTAQEVLVARLVAAGQTNRQVAAELYLSPRTVEYHLAGIFSKLGIRSRYQLMALIHDGNPGVID